jgi:glycyl-tRNA synthetase
MVAAEGSRVVTMDKVASLSKRRGFVFPGSEIYGGLANTWDYGPLGVELKRNVKDLWWKRFVHHRRNIVGLDAGILMHPRVWEASGHVESFNDPLVDCRTCRSRFRADHLIEERTGKHVEGLSPAAMSQLIRDEGLKCPVCGNAALTDARQFNMMFRTTIGPLEATGTEVFLRPETAQAIFVQFKNIVATGRVKVPFGIAQIGKAFRNEITPGNFIFRLLEFEQMEIEYFVRPEDAGAAFEAWIAEMKSWLRLIGIRDEFVRLREHDPDELSHYSSRTVDVEYLFPGSMGWRELYGLANRSDFDLRQHETVSGQDLHYFDQAENRRYLPHVIEPTFGVDRTCLALLIDAYDEESIVDVNGKPETRTVLRLNPKVAPYKAAVLPLMKKPELAVPARQLFEHLADNTAAFVDYDETGNIGKRYRRQDEIGTPFCFTVDYETLDDNSVTVRHRDDMSQERLRIPEVADWLSERLA